MTAAVCSDWNNEIISHTQTHTHTHNTVTHTSSKQSSLDAAIGWSLLMLVKIRFESKSLVALSTAETLDRRMCLHVSAQIGAVGECLVAQVAFVRLLSRVWAHVTLQEPRPGERLGANWTDVGQGMRQQVHRQGRHGDISLAASGARFASARFQIAMRLFVTRQVGRRRVRLAAFVAHVASVTSVVIDAVATRWPLT